MLEPSTVVRKSSSQVSCVLNEEVAVLNVEKALYFGLQGVGAHIWDFLETPHSVAEICDDVTANFDVTPDVCRQDVLKFLGGMLDAGLIETSIHG
ncbi:MAG: PqqD family protein [Reyranella sp.]|nr:MAG: PqqD family protein [Reyranella sp.]